MKENEKITAELLLELGFRLNESKSKNRLNVYTRNRFEVVIVDDGSAFYSNLGFDYPVKDLQALKKLYKEVRRAEL